MGSSDMFAAPPGELTPEAIDSMQKIILRFKKEFGRRCNWDDEPKPLDASDAERNKALITTMGLCVKHLLADPAMLQQAKEILELSGIAHTAEMLKQNTENN